MIMGYIKYTPTDVPKNEIDTSFKLSYRYDLPQIDTISNDTSNNTSKEKDYNWGSRFNIPQTITTSYTSNSESSPISNTNFSMLDDAIKPHLGRAYGYGSKGKTGKIDCSGFTKQVMESIGKNIPDGSIALYLNATYKFNDVNQAKAGDLIFLKGTNKSRGKDAISHVILALGNGEFAEASSSKGVIKHKIDFTKGYYKDHFAGVGRYAKKGMKFLLGGETPNYYVQYNSTNVPNKLNISKILKNLSLIIPVSNTIIESTTESKKDYNWGHNYNPQNGPIKPSILTTALITSNQNITHDPNGISEGMLNNLLYAEGGHLDKNGNFIAKKETKFGENFVTGPYGMTINLKTGQKFKEGEIIDKQDAINNARQYYSKTAKLWKLLLAGKEGLTLNKLDALVSASGGTAEATNSLKKFVLKHWGDDNAIANKLRNFATTAAGNGKRQNGLVLRRLFEADWYLGKNKDLTWYLLNRKQFGV